MFINKGIIIFTLLISSNIGLALWFKYLIIILMLYYLFRFIYSTCLITAINHGKILYIRFKINNGLMVEYFILLIHWIPLNLIFLKLLFYLFR